MHPSLAHLAIAQLLAGWSVPATAASLSFTGTLTHQLWGTFAAVSFTGAGVATSSGGGFSLPAKTVREIIAGSIDVIIQAARLRDGSRRITAITEVIGMEGDVIITQDLMRYEIEGEDAAGRLIGRHMSTGIGKPNFWDRARYYNEEKRLAAALDEMEAKSKGA